MERTKEKRLCEIQIPLRIFFQLIFITHTCEQQKKKKSTKKKERETNRRKAYERSEQIICTFEFKEACGEQQF